MCVKVDYIKNGDCLELMKEIEAKSIDMILCDLPFGTTKCEFDSIIPFEPLWEQYNRIIKDNGAIVLFSGQPFTSDLINSNRKMYRYEIIWEKTLPTGFLNAKKMPLRCHENICVFYKKLPTYNPQMQQMTEEYMKEHGYPPIGHIRYNSGKAEQYGEFRKKDWKHVETGKRYPRDVIKFSNWNGGGYYGKQKNKEKTKHPTQKPVSVLEYLVKTYTNEGDIILDNCMGSGSTCIAAINTNRHYIGYEKEKKYFDISKERIEQALKKMESEE